MPIEQATTFSYRIPPLKESGLQPRETYNLEVLEEKRDTMRRLHLPTEVFKSPDGTLYCVSTINLNPNESNSFINRLAIFTFPSNQSEIALVITRNNRSYFSQFTNASIDSTKEGIIISGNYLTEDDEERYIPQSFLLSYTGEFSQIPDTKIVS